MRTDSRPNHSQPVLLRAQCPFLCSTVITLRAEEHLLCESLFTTGGKPSTWFPPGGLVEQSPKQRQHSKRLAIDDRAARRSQATKQQQELRTRQVHYEQTNERTNKQTNKQTNKRTNERTRTNKPTTNNKTKQAN